MMYRTMLENCKLESQFRNIYTIIHNSNSKDTKKSKDLWSILTDYLNVEFDKNEYDRIQEQGRKYKEYKKAQRLKILKKD